MFQTALIVDDLPDCQQWLTKRGREAFPGIVVNVATTVAEGVSSIKTGKPELLLIDFLLPDGCGVDLLRAVSVVLPRSTAVVTTVCNSTDDVTNCLAAGAFGYLLKDEPEDQFVARLQGIARGEPPISPAIARKLLFEHFRAKAAPQNNHEDLLSPREREVLLLIANGYTLNEVGTSLSITRHTVATHVRHIYEKLHIGSRAEAVTAARQLGFLNGG